MKYGQESDWTRGENTMTKGNGHPGVPWSIRAAPGPTNGNSRNTRFSSRVAGLFDDYGKFRGVIHELEEAGYDSKKLSVLAKGELCDRLWSELRGIALVWIPDLGSLVLAGPLAWEIATALRSANGGTGKNPLEMALASVGLPNERIFEYEEEVRSDKYLLILEGSREEVQKAHVLMSGAAFQTDLWMGTTQEK
jgi:hypothetical protein